MKEYRSSHLTRRTFITSASSLIVGSSLLHIPGLAQVAGQEQTVQETMLTPEEQEWVKKFVMAADLDNYFHKGYSCAESLLMVSLRYLKKPEELVWAAAGFGGGMGQKDVCGFLTAGVMGIGFACGGLDLTREEAKKTCGGLVKEYWKWWADSNPIHCRIIRPEGSSSQICVRLGKLAAAKVEELILEARS
ncbi:MAG: C_GCAxxG_C_C family protein [Candidatus Aminicenantes bacterium]|nr:C_GCAxxG_C_C family protein [Candidatus Aminicenantes bacterium]